MSGRERLEDVLDMIAWRETRTVPRCDMCHQATHRSKLTTIPPQLLEQDPIDLCPECYAQEPKP
ncbi:MAG TPA: hypothetical protein VGP44_11715 [Gemmatimonadales bacterium]|nr:hypothetical protein [Gemmatimonadales bacterium]